MAFKSIDSIEEVEQFLQDNELAFIYITQPNCSVCHGLEPQITPLFKKYPSIEARKVDASEVPEVAGKFNVFTAPVALLFVDSKEYIDRKSTRLNSSHVAISYAVFCLKKKSR